MLGTCSSCAAQREVTKSGEGCDCGGTFRVERDEPEKPQIFSGALVRLHTVQRIDPGESRLPTPDLIELAKGRVAKATAEFILKTFVKTEVLKDGSIDVSVALTVLLGEAPAGVAHTKIVFQEAPG